LTVSLIDADVITKETTTDQSRIRKEGQRIWAFQYATPKWHHGVTPRVTHITSSWRHRSWWFDKSNMWRCHLFIKENWCVAEVDSQQEGINYTEWGSGSSACH